MQPPPVGIQFVTRLGTGTGIGGYSWGLYPALAIACAAAAWTIHHIATV